MLSNKKQSSQIGLFNGLADQLDQKHPLYLLANRVNWSFFEDAFKKHYHETLTPDNWYIENVNTTSVIKQEEPCQGRLSSTVL